MNKILASAGCVLDPARNRRPARLLLGANARHFTAPGFECLESGQSGSVQVLHDHRLGCHASSPRTLHWVSGLAQNQLHLALEHRSRGFGQSKGVALPLCQHMTKRNQLPQHRSPLVFSQV